MKGDYLYSIVLLNMRLTLISIFFFIHVGWVGEIVFG